MTALSELVIVSVYRASLYKCPEFSWFHGLGNWKTGKDRRTLRFFGIGRQNHKYNAVSGVCPRQITLHQRDRERRRQRDRKESETDTVTLSLYVSISVNHSVSSSSYLRLLAYDLVDQYQGTTTFDDLFLFCSRSMVCESSVSSY